MNLQIPPDLFDDEWRADHHLRNANQTALLFPLEDGLEVLYREGGFGLNFARGLGIIFCWMALLAALGLMAASFLSFPVAAFFSLAMLLWACRAARWRMRCRPARWGGQRGDRSGRSFGGGLHCDSGVQRRGGGHQSGEKLFAD